MDGRPDLRTRVGDHSKAGGIIVEADPGDLLESVEGGDELCEGKSEVRSCMILELVASIGSIEYLGIGVGAENEAHANIMPT